MTPQPPAHVGPDEEVAHDFIESDYCNWCGVHRRDHAAPPAAPAMRRCKVSTNPCGTDTWAVDYSCPCPECQAYLRERAAPVEPPAQDADADAPSDMDHGGAMITVASAPDAVEALRELVACRDLKERLDSKLRMTAESEGWRFEYERRKPLAWAAARAVLQSLTKEGES